MPTNFIPDSLDTTPSVTREPSRDAYTPETFRTDARTMETETPPKIASVVYMPHEGVPANSPYDVKNKQMVSFIFHYKLGFY